MYAAADFNFNQADNGWLTSEFAFMRGLVLIFIFPRIIAWGRSLISFATPPAERSDESDETFEALLPSSPGLCNVAADGWAGKELDTSDQGHRGSLFDLVFLRWSLVVDAVLTTLAAFSTRRWHVYVSK